MPAVFEVWPSPGHWELEHSLWTWNEKDLWDGRQERTFLLHPMLA